MPKRPNAGSSTAGKRFIKRAKDASRESSEGLLRRRILAQRTRLTRALERAQGADKHEAEAVIHLDGYSHHIVQSPAMVHRVLVLMSNLAPIVRFG